MEPHDIRVAHHLAGAEVTFILKGEKYIFLLFRMPHLVYIFFTSFLEQRQEGLNALCKDSRCG